MTATAGEVGVESTSLEEHEWEIPCDTEKLIEAARYEWAGPVCAGDPARWYAVRGCCGNVNFLCDSCKDQYMKLIAGGAMHICVMCNAKHSNYSHFEPLRRS